MDLTKFVLLLTRQSLYFPCLTELEDPYEGFMPQSHIREMAKVLASVLEPIANLRSQMGDLGDEGDAAFTKVIENTKRSLTYGNMRNRFAVNCWHGNEDESEAMWKTYSALGAGIAIQSTVAQLQAALAQQPKVNINRVRYVDFKTVPIDKGKSAYYSLYKRRSFEHEREVRATLMLETPGVGQEVPCDLKALITRVYISPKAGNLYVQAVKELCSGLVNRIELDVIQSSLYDPPDYDLNTDFGMK